MSDRVPCPSESEWKYCTRCPLCLSRRNVVLRGWGRVRRGSVDRDGFSTYYAGIPATERTDGLILTAPSPFVLFIGEAPSELEDIRGLPFIGEAGRIFNYSLSLCKTSFSFEITNLIACRPTRYSTRHYSYINRPPRPNEIEACKPRLTSLLATVKYSGIIYLGNEAQQHKVRGIPTCALLHPAAILRKEFKLYDIKRFASLLDTFILSLP